MNKFILTIIVILCVSGYVHAQCENILNEVLHKGTCTKIRTYKSQQLTKHPILLVSLHGDTAPWNYSFVQYNFAERIASKSTNLVAVGMLRPGYIDQNKRVSDGSQGEGVGDNYNEKRVQQISDSIQNLKQYYQASRVILAGDSGGAATAANLIALHPGLVDHALLTACPCDINLWRKNMFELTKKSIFKGDLRKTSPIDIVGQISNKTSITMLVGRNDLVTPPSLNKMYQSALVNAGKDVELYIIEGNHEILFNTEVLEKLTKIISNYNEALQLEGKPLRSR